ncbi:ATP-dependent DNA helicase pfh1-like [Silene latifolia]|uniref:ATP-dependent DNA helicase pfh1-like n=1 Tax=Silene latifolia TaxID=37657 RepID=UPI003D76CD7E
MSKRQNIESLDHLLRDLCDSNLIFGGKVVVFGGDFRQTLPILPRKSQREIVEASLFSSHLWPTLIKFSLTENLRAKDDPEFAQFLLALGNGELQTKEYESIELPAGIVRVLDCANTNPIGELAALTFPELAQGTFDTNLFTNRAILTPLNDDVDAINDALIEQFPGQAVTYTSYDSMLDDTCAVYPAEFINKLNPGGMSPHKLVLKVNCPVILIRNLQPSFGLCNGTRLICKRFLPNTIECVIMTGQHKGDCVLIPRIKLRPAPSTNYPFQFQRNQFPLKLSFAMTVNKCQGQTLSQVAVYLPRPCFSHGQLYVALSRARKAAQVTVIAAPGPETAPASFVRNVVSYEALSLAGILSETTT